MKAGMDRAEGRDGLPEPSGRAPDLVGLAGDVDTFAKLGEGLAAAGLHMDVVTSLEELRDAIFRCGGPDALLLAPDMAPAQARAAIRLLQDIDRDPSILTFDADLTRLLEHDRHVRSVSFHPSSRAAVGTVLQALAAGRDAPDE